MTKRDVIDALAQQYPRFSRREAEVMVNEVFDSMTKRDVIDALAQQYPRFSRREAEVMVNEVFDSMTKALVKGERIEIRGFGSFWVKLRRARDGRNPRTGAVIAVAAKRVPQFKVGKALRYRVDGQLLPAGEGEEEETEALDE